MSSEKQDRWDKTKRLDLLSAKIYEASNPEEQDLVGSLHPPGKKRKIPGQIRL
jgi:hypothetical protein